MHVTWDAVWETLVAGWNALRRREAWAVDMHKVISNIQQASTDPVMTMIAARNWKSINFASNSALWSS
jgi:hypothetical protein